MNIFEYVIQNQNILTVDDQLDCIFNTIEDQFIELDFTFNLLLESQITLIPKITVVNLLGTY